MSDVVAWLESPEGDAWRMRTIQPLARGICQLLPAETFSTEWRWPFLQGPLRPQHDPCGRPPMPP